MGNHAQKTDRGLRLIFATVQKRQKNAGFPGFPIFFNLFEYVIIDHGADC